MSRMNCFGNVKGREPSWLEVEEEWKSEGGGSGDVILSETTRGVRGGLGFWKGRVRGSRQCEVKRKYLWFLNEFKNSPSALFALRTGSVLKEIVQPRNKSVRCCFPQLYASTTMNIVEILVCVCAGWYTAVWWGSRPRVVSEGLPDHTGGGGGRQEHQQTGGTRDAHCIRHPHSLVGLSISATSLWLADDCCNKTYWFGRLTGNCLAV